MWVQQGKLLASDGTGADNFGWAMAVSGDTVVLGAPDKTQGLGATYLFVRSCGAWSEQQELMPPDGVANQAFGASVAIDGDTAIVGAQAAESYKGAAYVFVRSGGMWSEQATLTAGDGVPGDQFGSAVVIQGNTAIIGASGQAGSQGGVYVFTRSGGSWSQQTELAVPGGAAGDQLGFAAAMDGETAMFGAPGSDAQRGAVYVFARAGGSWSQGQKLTAGDAQPGDQLGSAVALSDGTAILGAYERTQAQGAAYAFVRSGSSWTQQQELSVAGAAAGDRFGWTVALTGDTAVVGAPSVSASMGAAYVFVRAGASWSLGQTLGAADAMTGDSFGYTAAISGTTTVVGALYSSMNQGAAYVFVQGDMGTGGGGSCESGSGSGSGAGSGMSGTDVGGAAAVTRDIKDHIPFAFKDCGCRIAGASGGGLGALALAVIAAGLWARRRRP